MPASKRIIGLTLAIAAIACAFSVYCGREAFSRDPDDQSSVQESVDADTIRGLVAKRNSEASLFGGMHPAVVSMDMQIEEMRVRANLPPHWPSNDDPLRIYRSTRLAQPTIDALVDRVLLLEAEVRALKASSAASE
ncbi:hypothetical protein [Rubripirellula reticaptiva]|uniref:Uncharacterized protein n=1 Tax=Rubripirellula reticaptiva TaxID=2528013 RepID=A0A5C6FA91_9BACT|nr:hypothetical protein [Rubripirellula reticaptiva]TWU57417.1 hypothetical protein Poly59_03240 [Rubripirellula reticaptiva]